MATFPRLIHDPQLEPFFQGIDGFCAKHLPELAGPIELDERSFKIFADPIEGYVRLSSWEVAIVDTPLFQRLRSIRQLGLAYLVYPTLGYSRFEHTLGVLARLTQIVGNLEENQAAEQERRREERLTDERQLIAAHLAVLGHDLGHSVFSHVSEAVIEQLQEPTNYPSSQAIGDSFSAFAGRRVPIAEVLSVAIVTSQPFVEYIEALGVPFAGRANPAMEMAHDAARLILGLPMKDDPGSLFLGQLLSSGLDADKLDYMLRESHFSGISLGISLGWLLKKVHVRKLPFHDLPGDLKSRVRGYPKDTVFSVLALQKGGQFAFEEFCVARLALHEKIYLHQKIRAAEVFIRDRLRRLAEEIPSYREVHRWLYLRESQFEYPELELPALDDLTLFNQEVPRTGAILDMEALGRRSLLYRAFAFGWYNAIAEPLTTERSDLREGTDTLMTLAKDEPTTLVSRIASTLEQMLLLLGLEDLRRRDPSILLDPPRLSSIQQGYETLYIDHPSRLSVRWTMPIDRIVEYYHRNRALAYIFAHKDMLPYVLLAAEKTVWDLFGVLYVQEGIVKKRTSMEAEAIRHRLHEAGFYVGARALQPISDFLNGVHAQSMVSTIAEKLAQYESRTKRRVSPASVTTYVAQFPTELQEAALEWLQHLRWVDPGIEIRNALKRVLNAPPFETAQRISICPLGGTSDSANRIAYDLRDIDGDYPGRTLMLIPLNEALARRADGYIIYDDNTNTGLQGINVVAAWLGIALQEELRLEEDHVQPLDEELRRELKSKPVAFVFAVAPEDGTSNFHNLLVERTGFTTERVLCHAGMTLPKRDRIFSGPGSPFQHARKLDLLNFLTDVGKSILLSEDKGEDEATRRALGANAGEAMIVFPYNTPTMTITALWISGAFHEEEWFPLVERARREDAESGRPIGEDA